MDMKMVLAPILGAGIGYSTNWIAIKMLFRPYTEKRVMGIKLPFTPGLIPKERDRVAKSIGQVIEEYLLTDKIIINEMLEDKAKKHVLELVNDNIYTSKGNINLNSFIADNDNNFIVNRIADIIGNRLLDLLNEENTKNKIQQLISSRISNSLREIDIIDLISEEQLNDKYNDIINNNVKDMISSFLSEKMSDGNCICDIIDVEMINRIKGMIINYIDSITDDIKIFENERLKQRVVELIDSTIKEKVGALGAMFVNGESVYNTIAEKTKEKLQDIEIKEEINTFINSKIDEVTNRPIEEIMTSESREELISYLACYFTGILSEVNIIDIISLNDLDLYSFLEKVTGNDVEDKINNLVADNYEKIINDDKTSGNINNFIVEIINKMITSDISVSIAEKQQLDAFIVDKYTQLVNNNMTKLMKDIKLSSIIERQLNQFDIKMLEDIIISIAKKELNAITLLGGLLGFVITFLAVLL
ncbi:hypothetical protein SH1V18_35180 [Vallitalea longa]|uniref:DUF445 family protein n=1 Tax=Vallitalea longa TaxID=2936439 RepID=A0A9W6DH31_9FIRM|nr:DUF445 family protein [Vallitalea longa]GKX31038.1 hypothetical protein SH1V18_35180 [Vallitalea longa]